MSRLELAVPGARSLVWHDGGLVDVAAGWRRYGLDGSEPVSRYSGYGRGFDAAVMAPAADVVALVASTGTKALLLEPGGKFIREVNRSYYHAEAYRYPLALFTLPDGRTGLVHCPEEYNQLEIEVARTGERLTGGQDRDPEDFFHSRLAVSPDGRFLLSAGWVWHPLSLAEIYELPRALEQPRALDAAVRGDPWTQATGITEISGACFAGQDIVISTSADEPDTDDPGRLGPRMLARWSAAGQQFTWIRQLAQAAGDLLALGGSILALYQCPRLYDATTGEPQAEWLGLDTGRADSSIVWDKAFSGPARIAVDEPGQRFAVTDGQEITVIQLG
jgi:hypothetical protein